MKVKQEFFGFNPVMWMGVVEDNEDPIKLGRLRVRIFGWHNGSPKEVDGEPGVKTEELPWAQVMQPVNAGPNSGIGGAVTGIVKGTWVMGMFLDGEIAREPMVMGSIGGLPTLPNPNPDGGPPIEGFYDPTGSPKGFPKETASWALEEPDTNRLTRNDNVKVHGDPADYVHNAINRKMQNQMKTQAGLCGYNFDEPVLEGWDKFRAKYPHNKVWETKQGHIFEVDDTPAEERIHIYHQNGSYFNFDNGDGKLKIPRLIVKSTGDYYTFGQRNHYTAVPDGDIRSLSRHWSHMSEGMFSVDAKAITLKGHTKIKGNVVVEALEVRSAATCNIVDVNGAVYTVRNGIVYASTDG